jgi:aconitate hydratase 2/2-methylisocitrate dehydratase
MKAWIANPELLRADADAEYAAVIEIDMNKITEPILACPNDPDDVKTLTEIHEAGMRTDLDEVFVGSCMTNIGLFRAFGEIIRGEQFIISSGITVGLQVGDVLAVYDSSKIINGVGGQRFFLPGLKTGEIKIVTISENSAQAERVSGEKIKAGSTVRKK